MGPVTEASDRLNGNRRDRMQATAALLASLDSDAKHEVLHMADRLRRVGAEVNNAKVAYAGEAAGGYDQHRGADSPNQGTAPYQDPFTVSLDNLEHAMRYQPWNPVQVEQGDRVREALTSTARVLLRELQDTPIRRRLLEEVLQLRMLANMAISFPWGFGGLPLR